MCCAQLAADTDTYTHRYRYRGHTHTYTHTHTAHRKHQVNSNDGDCTWGQITLANKYVNIYKIAKLITKCTYT